MSPSARTRTDDGWSLTWAFDQVVTGHDIGMALPEKVQPGKLATELSLSAPISLLFFFLVLFVLDRLRNIGMHPVNYALLAGAFFAFHLLFSYSVDHLNVVAAFALASVVSLALVVSYLRLVVSARFAFVEAALAQGVYLVGFSLAHFWSGYTGLTVTVLSVATLFLLMQWTGRIDWNEAWKSTRNSQKTAAPASEAAV
jgi:inner membrane protein involved in colicin E2 resistance